MSARPIQAPYLSTIELFCARMVQNLKDEEEVEETDEFPCQICGESFDSQQALEEHGERAHEDTDEDYSKQP